MLDKNEVRKWGRVKYYKQLEAAKDAEDTLYKAWLQVSRTGPIYNAKLADELSLAVSSARSVIDMIATAHGGYGKHWDDITHDPEDDLQALMG